MAAYAGIRRCAPSTLAALELGFMRDCRVGRVLSSSGREHSGFPPRRCRERCRMLGIRSTPSGSNRDRCPRRGDRLSLLAVVPVPLSPRAETRSRFLSRAVASGSHLPRCPRSTPAARQREIDLSDTYGTAFGDGGEVFIGAFSFQPWPCRGSTGYSGQSLGFRMSF